jgi:uncharacterized protein (TIGR00369 family)
MPHIPEADPRCDARVRESFARQRFLHAMGVTLERVAPGEVDMRLPFRADLTQQHGFLHAGAMTAVVDTACGYAALTLMPPDAAVLTAEFKVISPPGKTRLVARASSRRAARSASAPARSSRAGGGAAADDDCHHDDRPRPARPRRLGASPVAWA